jgi:hypothetical protein
MKLRFLCVSALLVLTIATVSAQTKTTMSGKCSKADVQQSIPAGDQQGHVFMLAQGKCTVTGDVSGAAGKEGAYSSHSEATPTHLKEWGVYTVTFDNGDKIYYNYQGVGTMKDGALLSETNKYQIASGTGKMKGLKGSGGCKLTPTSDGGVDYSCTGDYSSGGAAMAKP